MRIFGGHGQTDEPGLQENLVAFLFLSRLAGILADARAAALAVLPPVQTVMSFRVMFGTAIHNDEVLFNPAGLAADPTPENWTI